MFVELISTYMNMCMQTYVYAQNNICRYILKWYCPVRTNRSVAVSNILVFLCFLTIFTILLYIQSFFYPTNHYFNISLPTWHKKKQNYLILGV